MTPLPLQSGGKGKPEHFRMDRDDDSDYSYDYYTESRCSSSCSRSPHRQVQAQPVQSRPAPQPSRRLAKPRPSAKASAGTKASAGVPSRQADNVRRPLPRRRKARSIAGSEDYEDLRCALTRGRYRRPRSVADSEDYEQLRDACTGRDRRSRSGTPTGQQWNHIRRKPSPRGSDVEDEHVSPQERRWSPSPYTRHPSRSGRSRSVANSEDYGELKDFVEGKAPRQGHISRRALKSWIDRQGDEAISRAALKSWLDSQSQDGFWAPPVRRRRAEPKKQPRKRVRLLAAPDARVSSPEPEKPEDDRAKDDRSEPRPEPRKASAWQPEHMREPVRWTWSAIVSTSPKDVKKTRTDQASTTDGGIMKLVRDIKRTTLRRQVHKRWQAEGRIYKKSREQREAEREAKDQVDPYSVIFSHLSRRVPEDYLRSLFEEHGEVSSIEIWRGPNGDSLGAGRCTFTSTKAAARASELLSGWFVHGRTMHVAIYRPDRAAEACEIKEVPSTLRKDPKWWKHTCAVKFSNANQCSTEGFMRSLFSKCGVVISFSLQRSCDGKSLGRGTCTFDSRESAEDAVDRFDGARVDNNALEVELDETPPKDPRAIVFFHNVKWTTSSDELKRSFQAYGTVENFELRLKSNGRSLGMGTCQYANMKQALKAIAGLHGAEIGGRQLYVSSYNPAASCGFTLGTEKVKAEPCSDGEHDMHPAFRVSSRNKDRCR
eukprot:TRINITY_DN7361_c0_g1_i2.p1 TRINITY_DN7361_c0_g1~~TRINITY_DN7361_c0_g1_i2.p1  ORF type:complete len:713 (-),score=84.32 TRINITY_DN7361_c0_g1_i2:38-2176(-)